MIIYANDVSCEACDVCDGRRETSALSDVADESFAPSVQTMHEGYYLSVVPFQLISVPSFVVFFVQPSM